MPTTISNYKLFFIEILNYGGIKFFLIKESLHKTNPSLFFFLGKNLEIFDLFGEKIFELIKQFKRDLWHI